MVSALLHSLTRFSQPAFFFSAQMFATPLAALVTDGFRGLMKASKRCLVVPFGELSDRSYCGLDGQAKIVVEQGSEFAVGPAMIYSGLVEMLGFGFSLRGRKSARFGGTFNPDTDGFPIGVEEVGKALFEVGWPIPDRLIAIGVGSIADEFESFIEFILWARCPCQEVGFGF